MAPLESVRQELSQQFPCRKDQIQVLSTLFEASFPSPPTTVVHGLEATGKSVVVRAVLQALDVPHAIIDSKECITTRQLLEQAVAATRNSVHQALGTGLLHGNQIKCETVNALENHLEKNIKDVPKFVLVFDGVDRQKEAPMTLLPGLARLGTIIPNLSIVFIITVPNPRLLHLPGTPHIQFPTYSKEDMITILSLDPQDIFLERVDEERYDYGEEEASEDKAWLWPRYCAVVWDSIGKGAARDLRTFTLICYNLWRPFVQPIVDGTHGTRDFSKLLVSRRSIFQGDEALTGKIISAKPSAEDQNNRSKPTFLELPYYAKFLLCAGYLASYNPPRQDKIYFMKSTERKRRRRGGNAGGRASKHRKIPRHLLNPSPFSLDRMLAILQSILIHPVAQTGQISAQIATLTSLRLLLRTGAGTADLLDPATRFRVNCSWEYVSSLGRSVGIELRDYLAT
ncbi:origin recognition complex subunit Orc5 [Microthyrium microscopicum]|uniref:Origin recognition complex subunit Orc5 n=1 Tax=Microthyrium microscopicum TaxID=703497 RepID=A0A6A6UJL4_9PEZI|nr:origin recognition complex subunit Orc5 [Microthyrium microscopicum]